MSQPGRDLENLRVAIVHEWFETFGGAELVTNAICETVPQADLFSLWDDTNSSINESFLARSPLRGKKALALPLMPIAHRLYKGSYDLVISSSHAFAHTTKFYGKNPNTKYISYIHTPARYLWSPELDPRGANPALAPMRSFLKQVDRNLGSHVSSLAVNSQETANRVSNYWGKDSTVIYPPVDIEFFSAQNDGSDFSRPFEEPYLVSVGRWISYKRVDLCIEVAAELGMPIAILGSGPLEEDLRQAARRTGARAVFEIAPSRERVRYVLQNASCMVFPAHEDFGIVPVEAMATGCPVAGFNVGGLKETVTQGEGGFLAAFTTKPALIYATNLSLNLDRDSVAESVRHFDYGNFTSSLKIWIDNALR